jgi:hypothetical protein
MVVTDDYRSVSVTQCLRYPVSPLPSVSVTQCLRYPVSPLPGCGRPVDGFLPAGWLNLTRQQPVASFGRSLRGVGQCRWGPGTEYEMVPYSARIHLGLVARKSDPQAAGGPVCLRGQGLSAGKGCPMTRFRSQPR